MGSSNPPNPYVALKMAFTRRKTHKIYPFCVDLVHFAGLNVVFSERMYSYPLCSTVCKWIPVDKKMNTGIVGGFRVIHLDFLLFGGCHILKNARKRKITSFTPNLICFFSLLLTQASIIIHPPSFPPLLLWSKWQGKGSCLLTEKLLTMWC